MSKMRTTTKAHDQTKPWQRKNPKGTGEHKHLSLNAKAAAKRRAEEAGRPYPNLVDNMWAATHYRD